MEQYNLENDVKLFCVPATSFPEGVRDAWQTLHQKIGSANGRSFYGVSHGSKDSIVYKAAVEEVFAGEGAQYGYESITIPQGEYMAITVTDYMKHVPLIGQAFRRLLAHPQFDGVTPCIEWYKSNDEVVCMVKKKS